MTRKPTSKLTGAVALAAALVIIPMQTSLAYNHEDAEMTFNVPIKLKNILPGGNGWMVSCTVRKANGAIIGKTAYIFFKDDAGWGNFQGGNYNGTVELKVKAIEGKSLIDAEKYKCELWHKNQNDVKSPSANAVLLRLRPKPNTPFTKEVTGIFKSNQVLKHLFLIKPGILLQQ